MNKHIEAFDNRLINLFTTKAQEFHEYSEQNPVTAPVIIQIAQLYNDLINLLKQ